MSGQELYNPVFLNGCALHAKVPRRLEAPMQGAHDPALQAADIDGNVPVDLRSPRRDELSIVLKSIDGGFAQRSHIVHRFLEANVVSMHDHGDHVMSVVSSLLDVV